jgi:hypothetical protein
MRKSVRFISSLDPVRFEVSFAIPTPLVPAVNPTRIRGMLALDLLVLLNH